MTTCGSAPPCATIRSARAACAAGLALRHHETAQIVGLGDRRRQTDARDMRRQAKQPRQIERQQIAALRRHQRVQFVEHDAAQRPEQIRRVSRGEQQRQLLRRRQQNFRRIAALALALRGRRVAGAGLDADRQTHFRYRRFEIACNIDGERFERRNIERVQAAVAADVTADREETPALGHRGLRRQAPAQVHEARQKTRQRLAAAGRRDQQHRAAGLRLGQKLQLMRARRPAAAGEPARELLRKFCYWMVEQNDPAAFAPCRQKQISRVREEIKDAG